MFIEILCPDIELLVLSVPAYINKLAKCQCTNDFMGMASRASVVLVAYYYESWEQWPRPFHKEMTTPHPRPPLKQTALSITAVPPEWGLCSLRQCKIHFSEKWWWRAVSICVQYPSVRQLGGRAKGQRAFFFICENGFPIGFRGCISTPKCCRPNVYELHIARGGPRSLFQRAWVLA